MKRFYYNFMHKLAGIIAKIIGFIYIPFSRKYIHFADVEIAMKLLKPGDIILDRTSGELSTIVIPGFFKHAALYLGNGKIIDATSVGVQERSIVDLMMRTDNIAIMRVPDITDLERYFICRYAKSMIGTQYDFEVNIETKTKIFCSELVYLSVNSALQKEYFDLRESMGIRTLTPQDLRNAEKKLDLVWEKLA